MQHTLGHSFRRRGTGASPFSGESEMTMSNIGLISRGRFFNPLASRLLTTAPGERGNRENSFRLPTFPASIKPEIIIAAYYAIYCSTYRNVTIMTIAQYNFNAELRSIVLRVLLHFTLDSFHLREICNESTKLINILAKFVLRNFEVFALDEIIVNWQWRYQNHAD